MNNNFFIQLFEYNHHCNQQLFNKLTENKAHLSEKLILLFNHTINAHQIWNSRIIGEQTFGVYQINEFESLSLIDENNFNISLQILQNYNLDTVFEYKTSKGDEFINSVKEILFHVINHSTYHRAQIASECKLIGIDPLASDYILYTRIK
ncbi:MAG: hypothetical protein RLZZ175_1010 [Bacteroidota bacterium]|jgi:uncharacterized damage-inducible protein DinB